MSSLFPSGEIAARVTPSEAHLCSAADGWRATTATSVFKKGASMKASTTIVSGTFFGAEIEPGTFHSSSLVVASGHAHPRATDAATAQPTHTPADDLCATEWKVSHRASSRQRETGRYV